MVGAPIVLRTIVENQQDTGLRDPNSVHLLATRLAHGTTWAPVITLCHVTTLLQGPSIVQSPEIFQTFGISRDQLSEVTQHLLDVGTLQK